MHPWRPDDRVPFDMSWVNSALSAPEGVMRDDIEALSGDFRVFLLEIDNEI